MRIAALHILLVLAGSVASLHAQNVQSGLEAAVKWKWSVLPSEEKDWGLPLAEPPPVTAPPPTGGPLPAKKDPSTQAGSSIAPGDYEVKRGDALAIISRKSGVPVRQLKLLNALTNDTIRIGQVLKIPTAAELAALATPAPATPAPAATPAPGKHKKAPEKAPPEPEVDTVAEATLIQVFLDRENFSNGPIDGTESGGFRILAGSYLGVHPDLQAPDALRAKAVAVVGEPFTTYKLQPSDFRFISPPKASVIAKPASPLPATRAKDAAARALPAPAPATPARPSVTYEELLAVTYSAYRTPWEFVAERFHCDEAFLRHLNSNIKTVPTAETVFKVPNVTPFEIEKCFDIPLRPKADPEKPITATVVGLSRLDIRQGDQLIASMPMSIARPGLHGRGSWTILGAIAGPRLATRQEPTAPPRTATESDVALPAATPAPAAPTGPEQILAAGPRNPVGVFWINLAKADSTTPLPYGLHGTAIPYRMKAQQSLGGLRLSNWDIARIVRLLPEGTPLAWK